MNLFEFLAEELREIMAEFGFRTVDEMVGQSERLALRERDHHWKNKNLDLSPLLYKQPTSLDTATFHQEEQDHNLENCT